MIRHYLFPTGALLVLAIASTVSAQRPAATPAPTRPAPQPTQTAAPAGDAVALPISNGAVVQGGMFLDEKTGINKFTSTLKKLNGEFQRQKDEITQMQTRAT